MKTNNELFAKIEDVLNAVKNSGNKDVNERPREHVPIAKENLSDTDMANYILDRACRMLDIDALSMEYATRLDISVPDLMKIYLYGRMLKYY